MEQRGAGALGMFGTDDFNKGAFLSELSFGTPEQIALGQSALRQESDALRASDPRVLELTERQANTKAEASSLANEAIRNLNNPEELARIGEEYNILYRENLQADAKLSALGVPSHAKMKLKPFDQALALLAGYRGTPEKLRQESELLKQKVKNLETEAGILGERGKQARIQTGVASQKAEDLRSGSQAERKAAGFVNRMVDASNRLQDLGKPDLKDITLNKINQASTPFLQATKSFLNALLRKESGAAITQEDYEQVGPEYIPQLFDSPEVLAEKNAARQRAIDGIRLEAGRAVSLIDAEPKPKKRKFVFKNGKMVEVK